MSAVYYLALTEEAELHLKRAQQVIWWNQLLMSSLKLVAFP
jgi:hypothetical protein